ncbi:MAG: hypothetical protein JWP94_1971 [Mucilaginibacter sp.]|nr:hypothetical protein [Mucilaginibacter sp.]
MPSANRRIGTSQDIHARSVCAFACSRLAVVYLSGFRRCWSCLQQHLTPGNLPRLLPPYPKRSHLKMNIRTAKLLLYPFPELL